MLVPRTGGRRCVLTFRCPGTHRVPPGRPTPLEALRAGLITIDDIRRHPPELGPALVKLLRRKEAPL
jgi:hypothetical protein